MRTLIVLFGFVAAVPPAVAAGDWSLRAGVGWIDPDAGFDSVDLSEGVRSVATIDRDVAIGLWVERRLDGRLGLSLGVSRSRPTAKLAVERLSDGARFEDGDALEFVPVSLGLMVHLYETERLDLFVQPELVWAHYGDVEFFVSDERAGDPIRGDDDFAVGATVGADWWLDAGRRWAVGIAVQYIDTDFSGVELDDQDRGSVAFDPLTIWLRGRWSF